LIPTELYTAIPKGYEVQIRPRSGLALKSGITVLNTPGTIDADYRNSWGVILMNNDCRSAFKVYQGDRIAQAVLAKVEQIEWQEVSELDSTDRGLGGFGSTGSN
jgi:dUTP pyrophosphatase